MVISDISIIEFHSALAKKVRQGEIGVDEFDISRIAFYKDCLDGIYQIEMLDSSHKEGSVRLLTRYSLEYSLRTLDSLQLAVVISLQEREDDTVHFVSADTKFCNIARVAGFDVINPEKQDG